eukprot:scaffold4335_cov148-Skeletonema_menzelii.AAC.17
MTSLHAHKAAKDAMKSPNRERAAEVHRWQLCFNKVKGSSNSPTSVRELVSSPLVYQCTG